jgi:hypothetical protein
VKRPEDVCVVGDAAVKARRRAFLKRAFIVAPLCVFILGTLTGCDAFVRKFTRKPKKSDMPREEMVIAPEEYVPPEMTKEERYRQQFTLWKSWHDEFMTALANSTNHKKKVSCIEEAIKYLEGMGALLVPDVQRQVNRYIAQMNNFKADVDRDIYGRGSNMQFQEAERMRRRIVREFSYVEIKDKLL